MKKVYVEIRIENNLEIEVPDGLNENEAYTYIMDNCQDDIALAINGGDFALEIIDMDEPDGN